MAKKKEDKGEAGEDVELLKRVDQMMDPKAPDEPLELPTSLKEITLAAAEPKPEDAATAPALPGAPDQPEEPKEEPQLKEDKSPKHVKAAPKKEPPVPIKKLPPASDDPKLAQAVAEIMLEESDRLLELDSPVYKPAQEVKAESEPKLGWLWLALTIIIIVAGLIWLIEHPTPVL